MDKVLENAKELRVLLDETPEMKEYLKNKEALENSEDVQELKQNIANLRVKGKLEEANNLEKLYNAHPLVNNYEVSTFKNRISLAHIDGSDLPILIRIDIVFHFHCFEDDNGLSFLYNFTHIYFDIENYAG